MIIDGQKIPEEFEEIAKTVMALMKVLKDCDAQLGIRALSSTLSMVVVNTAPSREAAENLINDLADRILEIIYTLDSEELANWNESEGHTLQ